MKTLSFKSIQIHGPDAETFLQGQLTCDVTKTTETPSFGAYCDHKGRMIANFYIQRDTENAFYLILPASLLEATITELKKFGAFSKVTIEEVDIQTSNPETNKNHYINKGIAFLYPETSLKFTPQMINWEKHGGVSFDKGCYVGQEIVARTQHLGKLKRHLHTFTISNTESTPKPGDELTQDGKTIGVVCDAVTEGNQITGLAVIQDNALEGNIKWNGLSCQLIAP